MNSSVLTMAVRVMVVEDYEPFRRFLCAFLGAQEHLQLINELGDGLSAVASAEELQPDLIVLDIGLPGLNGIETARRIREVAAETKIVFLTQESSEEVVSAALRVGGDGYVLKARAQEDLLVAIDSVLQGRQFVSDGLDYSKM